MDAKNNDVDDVRRSTLDGYRFTLCVVQLYAEKRELREKMNGTRNIRRIPVDKDFAHMFKIRASMENKSMLQLSRDEARIMKRKYGIIDETKSLFFK